MKAASASRVQGKLGTPHGVPQISTLSIAIHNLLRHKTIGSTSEASVEWPFQYADWKRGNKLLLAESNKYRPKLVGHDSLNQFRQNQFPKDTVSCKTMTKKRQNERLIRQNTQQTILAY